MSSHSAIRISIPVPCTKKWDKMTLVPNGRHCAYCSKNVKDFTGYNDAGLYKHFNGNKEEVCGRFFTTQVNRPIKIPYKLHNRLYHLTIALGLTLIFTQATTAQAQNKPPLTSQKSILNPPQKTGPFPTVSTGILKGRVVDEKKEPIINAAVGEYQDGELKGGNITDYDGNYSISPLKSGDYEVLVIALGYDSLKQSDVVIGDTIATSDFILNKPNGINIETMGIIYDKPVLDFDNPGLHIFSATDISRIPH